MNNSQRAARLPAYQKITRALCLFFITTSAFTLPSVTAQAPPAPELPWQQDRLSDRVIPFSIANSTTAKQMLEISGIGDSQLRFLIDFEPIAGKDIDTTGFVLRHLHSLDTSDVKRWSGNHTLDTTSLLTAFTETPDDYRVDFYRIPGRVQRIQRQPIVEEAARLLGFRSFFWVWIKPDHSEIPVRIATRKLPIAWFPDEWKSPAQPANFEQTPSQARTQKSNSLAPDASFELDHPIAVDGLFLKIAEEQGTREIVMAAKRIEWLPQHPSPEEKINDGIALLSRFGFDAGLLDDLRRSNGKTMNIADTEAFFQILSILNTEESRREIQTAANQTSVPSPSVSDFLQSTRNLQGQLISLSADVRQITKVEINNEKMKLRLGLDHYWQLDAFVYLGEEAIQLKANEADESGLTYKYRYPVQICVIELPKTLQTAHKQIQHGTYRSNSLHEEISLHGFFFKLWTYQSARTMQSGNNRVQLSPLFIASNITVHEPADLRGRRASIYLGIGFVVALLIISGFLVKTKRVDEGARKQTEATRHQGGIDQDFLSSFEPPKEAEAEQ
ncbi:MAG: hypothetical protein CMM06_09925 [Rhodopirellula sp.]|nr:hypothetical protein [Rhodopirellula sp.]|tara:strand:+ start:5606 stop:7282 length:1677 start_codon:yes stop_codon:yes gene_type:complete